MSLGRLICVVALLAASFLTAAPVRAQARPSPGEDAYFDVAAPIAVGYATNAPEELGGVSLLVFGRPFARWGFYVDGKTGFSSPTDESNYDPGLTAADVESSLHDIPFDRRSMWRSVNVGVVRSLTGTFAVYAGGGVSDGSAYQEYFDPERVRGLHGYYWVEDAAASGVKVNLMAGAWLRLTERLLFQFGGELQPRGFTVGLTYAVFDGR